MTRPSLSDDEAVSLMKRPSLSDDEDTVWMAYGWHMDGLWSRRWVWALLIRETRDADPQSSYNQATIKRSPWPTP